MEKNLSNKISGIILIIYAIWALVIKNLFAKVIPPGIGVLIDLILQIGFFIVHGLGRYTAKEVLMFFVFGFVISNIIENLGVSTGFPFGHYHHTDILGPKIFLVPVLVAPSYIAVGYLSWTIAHSLIGNYGFLQYKKNIFILPLVASFVLASWDLCFDAVQSSLFKVWIWEKGGPHFGVPIENYFGWILNGFLFFLTFAFYLSRQDINEAETRKLQKKSYWYTATFFYGIIAVGIIISYLTSPLFSVKDAAGKEWFSGDVYQSLIITDVFTMIFITILSIIRIKKYNYESA